MQLITAIYCLNLFQSLTHSATLGLKYMCFDVICNVRACLWTF